MGTMNVWTSTLAGLDARLITVEVDMAAGIPGLTIVGLPDAAINESKERIKAAIKNSGFAFPLKKVVLNLAPADFRKEGSGFDLPMALGILLASESLAPTDFLKQALFVGELSLDGGLRRVNGILSIALMAKAEGFKYLVVPEENVAEASLIDGIDVFGLSALNQLPVFLFHPHTFLKPVDRDALLAQAAQAAQPEVAIDFCDIKGQDSAKRALEIAAAGGHNVLMIGPPGSGKSMLSKAFAGILPPLTFDEILEVSRIYSISGMLPKDTGLIHHRPYRSPHHSASMAGLTGGGSNPRPGEITLAHRGVLFLDEFVEFPRNVLEVLRQPLEDGEITISRAQQSHTFPARFQLVGAMNPCPCGYKGDPAKPCMCSELRVQRYTSKLSGPLLDRIDIHLEVPRLAEEELLNHKPSGSSSADIRQRVAQARQMQVERYAGLGMYTNAEMTPPQIRQFCALDKPSTELLRRAIQKMNLSARTVDRLLRLARTIADLASHPELTAKDVAEALQYRAFDRLYQQSRPAAVAV